MQDAAPSLSGRTVTRADCAARDRADPLTALRDEFVLPEGVVYLDGNSLGALPRRTAARLAEVAEREWGEGLIRSWNSAGWIDLSHRIGDKIATLVGARAGEVVVADSTSLNLFKSLSAAVGLQRADAPKRKTILSERGNFPTDLYIADSVAAGAGMTLRLADGASIVDGLDNDVAVLMLTHVNYRSGRMHRLAETTRAAHAAGALVVWDLCHSVGVMPIELDGWDVDYATGCTYKYLNGGPGSPAFLYVRADLIRDAVQPIQGWMGVKDSFRMGQGYEPADGIRRFISGTPPILGMLAMQATLELIEEAGMAAIRAKSIALTEYAIAQVDQHLVPLGAVLASPRDASMRGGHITVDHPRFAELVPRLWQEGILPDFRPPSGIRMGMSPLSTSFAEVETTVATIAAALRDTLRVFDPA
jgi:kynureninase